MAGRRRVLGTGNGAWNARLVFVGEAPGRLGADRTGIPFQGDASGRRFTALLEGAGWQREEVFVTNAVLCNPRDSAGRNRPPTPLELTNCREHLAATLSVLRPTVVVALGRRALAALDALHPAPPALRTTLPGTPLAWREGRWLAALVHPSPLAGARRSFAVQQDDWQRLRLAVNRLDSVGGG